MVDKASLRSYIIHHDQSGLSRPNQKGRKMGKRQYPQYNIYNVVNVNKAIMTIFKHMGMCFSGQIPRRLTRLLRPR
jgi:hypothetical protein